MLPKPLPIRDLTTMNPQLLRGQRPFLLRKASRGRRPQSPGNQFRARAQFLEVFPPAIRFRESPAATGLPQSSSKLRNSHVSLHTLSSNFWVRAIQKRTLFVKKLWTMRVPCGSARKTETLISANSGRVPSALPISIRSRSCRCDLLRGL